MHSAENTGDVRCLTERPSALLSACWPSSLCWHYLCCRRPGIVGMAAFGKPADPFRLSGLALIIAGMVGLKLASGH